MRRIFESPKAPWLVLALTLFVTLSSIELGFYNDDHAWIAALGGDFPEGPPSWDLYRFADPARNPALQEIGVLPWWATLDLKLHFFRPLSSALLRLDFALFGRAPLGYHLHSIAWYLGLVASVGWLFRAILPRATANLALAIYAFPLAHFYPWAWISCRHVLVGALPCVLGIAAFVRFPRAGPWLYGLGLALGLSGSEAALGSLAFPLAFVAVGRARKWTLTPALAVSVLYLVAYALLGRGAANSEGYVDPVHQPITFALRAATHLPMLLGSAVFTVPEELSLLTGRTPLVVLGIVAAGLVAWLWRSSQTSFEPEESAALPWLVGAGIAACVPSLGAFPGGRVLLVPNLGFAPLLAVLIWHGFSGAGWPRRLVLAWLVLVQVLLPPFLGVANAFYNGRIGRDVERISATADLGSARPRVFIIGTSDPMVTMYVPAVLTGTRRSELRCWSVLSGAKKPHVMRRIGERELLLRPASGAFVQEPFETLYRATNLPFHVGEQSHQCGATFRVTAIDDGRPTEIRITFDVALEDPSLRFLVWRDGRLVPLGIPALDQTLEIPWAPGPLANF